MLQAQVQIKKQTIEVRIFAGRDADYDMDLYRNM
jgi:hypothetical protein